VAVDPVVPVVLPVGPAPPAPPPPVVLAVEPAPVPVPVDAVAPVEPAPVVPADVSFDEPGAEGESLEEHAATASEKTTRATAGIVRRVLGWVILCICAISTPLDDSVK
jgi:hypothetical protein